MVTVDFEISCLGAQVAYASLICTTTLGCYLSIIERDPLQPQLSILQNHASSRIYHLKVRIQRMLLAHLILHCLLWDLDSCDISTTYGDENMEQGKKKSTERDYYLADATKYNLILGGSGVWTLFLLFWPLNDTWNARIDQIQRTKSCLGKQETIDIRAELLNWNEIMGISFNPV